MKRDLCRESIVVDGDLLEVEMDRKGRPSLRRVRDRVMAAVQATATKNYPAAVRIVDEVLNASSRTVSGADSYAVVSHLLSHKELDLCIRPNPTSTVVAPINIKTLGAGRGVVEVTVTSLFDVFRLESQHMGMEKPEQWLPISAVVSEKIDFLRHMTQRTLAISSPEVSHHRYEEKEAQDCEFLNAIDGFGF